MAWMPDYVSATELKSYLRIDDTVDDTELGFAITAASRAIDRHCNRQFGDADSAAERFYTARYDRRRCRYVIEIDDLHSSTGLSVTSVTAAEAITSYTLHPINKPVDGGVYTQVVMDTDAVVLPTTVEYDVSLSTTHWGWSAVPDTIKQACLLQSSRLFKRRESPFGVAGSPELGSEMRLLARVDPDVAVVLGPYVRWWGAQ